MTDQTKRRNGKWAKVSGTKGRWSCAKGWDGSISAILVQTWPTKAGAIVSANYWLED